MKVWNWRFKESTITSVTVNNEEIGDLLRHGFIGKKMLGNWPLVRVEDLQKRAKLYDCTGLTPEKPVLNAKTLQTLSNLLDGKAEALFLNHPREAYYAINVINVIDCLDFEKADIIKHPKYDVVDKIKRYAFKENMIEGQGVFKIPESKGSEIFVTDEFRNRVLAYNLTGFEFHEVWDSENPIPEPISLEQYLITSGIDGREYTFKEVLELLSEGKAFGNGKLILQNNENQNMEIGEVTKDGSYSWIEPIFYPPLFLDMKWYLIEKKK